MTQYRPVHLVAFGKSLCGSRYWNASGDPDKVTCKRCLAVLERQSNAPEMSEA